MLFSISWTLVCGKHIAHSNGKLRNGMGDFRLFAIEKCHSNVRTVTTHGDFFVHRVGTFLKAANVT